MHTAALFTAASLIYTTGKLLRSFKQVLDPQHLYLQLKFIQKLYYSITISI